MPGFYCCVYGCGNNTHHNKEKSFFSLPSEPEKLAVWLSLIEREDLLKRAESKKLNQRVCCDHFGAEHFKITKKLKKNAVPHLKLPNSFKQEPKNSVPHLKTPDSIKHEPEPGLSTPTLDSYGHQMRTRSPEPKQEPKDSVPDSIEQEPEPGPSTPPLESPLQDDFTLTMNDFPTLKCETMDLSDEELDDLMMTSNTSTTQTPLPLTQERNTTPRKRQIKTEFTTAEKKLKMEEQEADKDPVTKEMFLKLCDQFLDDKTANFVKDLLQ